MSRSGHGLLLIAFVWTFSVALVEAQTPLNVLLNAPQSSGLLERVVGQVSDLPVVIQVVAEADARVTIGVNTLSPLGWQLVIVDHANGETLTRDVVGDPLQPLAQSAVDEAAALVIRTVLQTILAHDQATRPTVPPPSITANVEEPAPPIVAANDSGTSATATEVIITRLWLGLGPQLAVRDRDLGALVGLLGHVGVQHGPFSLGVQAGYSFDAGFRDPIARVVIARHSLHLLGRMDLIETGGSRLSLLVSLGSHLWVRRTERVVAGWQGTSDRWIASPSGGLAGQWRLMLSDVWALGLTVGVDVLSRVPSLRYRDAAGVGHELARLAWFSPRALFGLELAL